MFVKRLLHESSSGIRQLAGLIDQLSDARDYDYLLKLTALLTYLLT